MAGHYLTMGTRIMIVSLPAPALSPTSALNPGEDQGLSECNADNNIARSLVPHVVTLELVIQESISMVDISHSLAKYKPLSIQFE